MPNEAPKSLRDWVRESPDVYQRFLWGAQVSICIGDLLHGSTLGDQLTDLIGRSVLVRTRDQLSTALCLIALDGVARRIVICPPDVRDEHLPTLVTEAAIDVILTDFEDKYISSQAFRRVSVWVRRSHPQRKCQ